MVLTSKERNTMLFLATAIGIILYFFLNKEVDVRNAGIIFAGMLVFALIVFSDFFPDEKLNANAFLLVGIFISGWLVINTSNEATKAMATTTTLILFGLMFIFGTLGGQK